MKTLFAAAMIVLSMGAAHAVEGGRDPYAQALPGAVTRPAPAPADTGSMSYPVPHDARAAASVPAYARPLPDNSSMGVLQTPNSLPRGAAPAR